MMAFEVGATVLILGLTAASAGTHPNGRAADFSIDGVAVAAPIALQAPPAGEAAPPAAPADPAQPAPSKPKPPPAEAGDGESKEGASGEGEGDQPAAPDAVTPGAASPAPDSVAPDSVAPDSVAPDSAAPDSATPGTAAPDTVAPGSAAPGAVAPDAVAPPAVNPASPSPPAADSSLPPSSGAAVPPATAAAQPGAPAPNAQDPAPAPGTPPNSEKADFQVGLTTPSAPAGTDQPTEDELSLQAVLGPGAAPMPSGFSLALSGGMSFGYSTFLLGNDYARDPMVDWSLSLTPAYLFAGNTRISANASLSQELTLSNGADEPQTLIFGDIGVNVSRPIYRFDGGPALSGSVSMLLPTSDASQTETLITTLGGRLNAGQPIGDFFVSFGSGFRKNFHRYTNPVRDPNDARPHTTADGLVLDELRTGFARTGGNELEGSAYFDGEANNTSMVWSNSLMGAYQATEKLAFALSYSLSHSWTYNSYELDELSGVGAKAGRGRNDAHGGTLSLNYQANQRLGFGAGMSTFGPTRTSDDKRIRFPFFAFEGKENNMTSFSISVTYTESIGL